jgi:hypothetical protein
MAWHNDTNDNFVVSLKESILPDGVKVIEKDRYQTQQDTYILAAYVAHVHGDSCAGLEHLFKVHTGKTEVKNKKYRKKAD